MGISASFWLNQISLENQNEEERQRVISNLMTEVNEIRKYCDQSLKSWNQDIDIYSSLLDDDLKINSLKQITRSKSRIEYNLIYYRDFDPPMNRYTSIINTGDLKYIQSENIKETLTRLHNLNFTKVASTVNYEKKIIELIIELITEENPSLFLKANNSKIDFESYLKSLHKFIKKNDKLKSNLVVQLKYFKTRISSLKYYMSTLEELQYDLKKL